MTKKNKLEENDIIISKATASYQQQYSTQSSSKELEKRAQEFSNALDSLRNASKIYFGMAIHSATGPTITVSLNGSLKKLLMCSSNDYLNLSTHPEVKLAITKAMEQYGVGMGSSRVGTGFSVVHEELERKLSHCYKKEAAILFPAGYDATFSTLKCLNTNQDAAILDRSCHASIFNGVKSSGAQLRSFRHNDTAHLESILKSARNSQNFNNLMVVLEGAYSMDGDIAKLKEIVPLCKKYDANIFIDEAHSIGLYGETGLGLSEQDGVMSEIDFIAGTFSKSLGSVGGFVAANKNFVNYINYFADKILFSAALPPMLIAGISQALSLISDDQSLKAKFWSNLNYLKTKMKSLGVSTVEGNGPTIILPIKNEEVAFELGSTLTDHGVFCLPYIYPAVPKGKAVFRISVQRLHSVTELDQIACAFSALNLDINKK